MKITKILLTIRKSQLKLVLESEVCLSIKI